MGFCIQKKKKKNFEGEKKQEQVRREDGLAFLACSFWNETVEQFWNVADN